MSKSGNILSRSMSNGNCLFGSASFSLVEDTSQVHEPKVMADVIIIIIIINTLFEIEKKKRKKPVRISNVW